VMSQILITLSLNKNLSIPENSKENPEKRRKYQYKNILTPENRKEEKLENVADINKIVIKQEPIDS
jgi:hypothetical protein